MNDSLSSLSDEALSELIVQSPATVSRTQFSTGEASDRIRRFSELYDAVPDKPEGAALLFREPLTRSVRCRPFANELVVGRLPKSERQPTASDLAVDDSTMSREHFKIAHTDGFYVLSDLGSLNGTFVNDKRHRLGETVLLIAGTTILAGDTLFVFTGC